MILQEQSTSATVPQVSAFPIPNIACGPLNIHQKVVCSRRIHDHLVPPRLTEADVASRSFLQRGDNKLVRCVGAHHYGLASERVEHGRARSTTRTERPTS